jgi:hypothetical protein
MPHRLCTATREACQAVHHSFTIFIAAIVPLGPVDLEQILCHQEECVVARDNTVVFDGRLRQLAKQPGRRSCASLRVLVRRHLDGRHSVWHGARCLGGFDARGRALPVVAAESPAVTPGHQRSFRGVKQLRPDRVINDGLTRRGAA